MTWERVPMTVPGTLRVCKTVRPLRMQSKNKTSAARSCFTALRDAFP